MPAIAHIRWKLLIDLNSKALAALPTLFNFSTGKGYIRTLGGRSNFDFYPQTLSPTNRFYDLLGKSAEDLGFKGRKFPLSYIDNSAKELRSINAQLRLYGKDLAVIELTLQSCEIGASTDLVSLTDLWSHQQLSSFTKALIGLVSSGDKTYRPTGDKPKVYPCVLIAASRPNLPSENLSVEILTRHREPDEAVVRSVLAKNRDLQIDASSLLIDRQGVLALIPKEHADNVTVNRRFYAASNMLEIMACLRRMKDKRKLSDLGYPGIAEIVKALREPEERFVHSTSSLHMWRLLAAEFKLQAAQFAEEQNKMQQQSLTDALVSKVLVVTALDSEATPILERLEQRSVKPMRDIYISTGLLRSDSGATEVYVFPAGVGNMPSALKTSMLIEALRPQLTVFCGIAGGRKDAKIGSVVVGNMVYQYESGKEKGRNFSPRPRVVDLSPSAASLSNAFMAMIRLEKLNYQVFFKPIACGEKVIASSAGPSGKLVSSTYSDALAIEMEGFGFLSAIRDGKSPGVLIRGISDLLDNKEEHENHELAANNAADLTMRMIGFFVGCQRTQPVS